MSHNIIHDEGDTSHVAAVFQKGKREKQDENVWQESQNSADTGDDTIYNQGNHHVAYM